MSDLSGKLGLWVCITDTILGHLHEIQALGFDYLIARIVWHPHSTSRPETYEPDQLTQLLHDAATIAMPVQAWAYVYPTGIADQVSAIAAALPPTATDLVLDVEVEWEGAAGAAAAANQLFHGIAEQTGHRADLHLSSFYNSDSHPLPYSACLAHCRSFMPQMYRVPPTSGQVVINRTLKQCPPQAHQSLGGQLLPTVNTPDMLQLVAQHAGSFQGASVWLWDGAGGDVGVSGIEDQWKAAIAAFRTAYPRK